MHQMASVNNTTTTNCAACGKEGGNLNMCNKCKMVTYCNAACKKKHRSKHKKACEKRVAELHDEALFKEHPPNEDCPICFLPLPLEAGQTTFQPCCGKLICDGCLYAMEEARGRGKNNLCAFCREPVPASDEEAIKQIKKQMESGNAYAFNMIAAYYEHGIMGMPQDMTKANELFLRAGELGYPGAYYNLGVLYTIGRSVDKKKAKHFSELAAMAGHVAARHNLGCKELETGNRHRAFKHFVLAAKAGLRESLDTVKIGFKDGIITKDEYANTLRAYQQRHDEMKSDDRDKAEAVYQRGEPGRR